jgi:hypothetical protein
MKPKTWLVWFTNPKTGIKNLAGEWQDEKLMSFQVHRLERMGCCVEITEKK